MTPYRFFIRAESRTTTVRFPVSSCDCKRFQVASSVKAYPANCAATRKVFACPEPVSLYHEPLRRDVLTPAAAHKVSSLAYVPLPSPRLTNVISFRCSYSRDRKADAFCASCSADRELSHVRMPGPTRTNQLYITGFRQSPC